MSRTFRLFTGSVFAVVAFIGLTCQAHAQREDPRQGREVRGAVKTVDASAITITIGGARDAAPTEKTYPLAKNVEVCTGGNGGGFRSGIVFKEAKLADLSEGTTVALALSADLKTVEAIVAEEPSVRGILKGVDAKKNTLTVSLGGGREQVGEDKTFVLGDGAEIAVDDGRGRRVSIREGKIEELAEGANVSLRLSLDQKQVLGVLAEGAMFGGSIKSIDAAKRSMTIVIRPARGDDAAEERTIAVAKEAVILLDDGKGRRLSLKEAKLADIPVGCAVLVKLAVDQSFVMMLKAEGPALFGLLKAVDAEKRTITIAIPKGRDDADEKTMTLAKDAHITLDGKDVKLADLKPGENGPLVQLRLTLDQITVQAVTARQPGVR